MWPQRVSDLTRTFAGSSWIVRLSVFATRLRDGVLESASLFPSALKQRRVLLSWIVTARTAQVTLLAVIAINLFVLPPARDRLVNVVFTKESFAEKLGGVFGAESRRDRRQAALRSLITSVAWFAGIGTTALVLWLHLPAAERRRRAVPRPRGSDTVAGRYRIEEEIGRGASGVVYGARDSVLERRVALKELAVASSDEDAVARFRREAKIVAQLSHPNIVQVYDLADEGGKVWIAMELVDSGDLSQLLAASGPLPTESATRFAHAVACAISYAHERGVIHRDLKPLNLLIDATGTVKVTDFGLAKLAESSAHTVEGTILGSPHYMSPEQADGQTADERSDIYSLGTILYHMLAGRPPFDGEIASVLMQQIRRPVPRLHDIAPDTTIPQELDALLMQMLAKDPDERPQSMREAAQRLAAFTVAPV
jgi:hypothetical protein